MIVSEDILNQKLRQLAFIGLSIKDLNNLSEIVKGSFTARAQAYEIGNSQVFKYPNTSNLGNMVNITSLPAYAVMYNVASEPLEEYDVVELNHPLSPQVVSYQMPNQIYVMNNSFPAMYNPMVFTDPELPESTNSSRKNTFVPGEESKVDQLPKTGIVSGAKIGLLRKVLEGIQDDSQILISSKPKNKSNKIRKSNRHSRYRGVSLNGKKWQVMIMGPIKKKYFGGIATEREAAIFYDKLSILTNGLAAKTNFNYRKSDLMKMMAELEYMETQVS
ncbi:unnamed protein product [Moneuplotes crassus]|uniref:AP2/ERF domain-containing protein n=1 Tax=Euplotes crassus TaxID=5936 RepID=A0AAD1XNB0_EUPCR|nr:unnamed protein product [Moneuplotes crassus]